MQSWQHQMTLQGMHGRAGQDHSQGWQLSAVTWPDQNQIQDEAPQPHSLDIKKSYNAE